MFPSFDDTDAPVSVDRWAVRLDEPAASPPVASPPDDDSDDRPFLPFTLDIPNVEYQPRLSRFGEAA